MRVAWCLLIAALATGCGSAQPTSKRPALYGISLDVPDGVSAEVTRGAIRIATSHLSVVVYEYEPRARNPAEEAFFNDEWPVELEAADFKPRGGTSDENTRAVSIAGRFFSVFTDRAPAPTKQQLDELNEALAGIEIRAGDFFRGSVQPVEFPQRPGWHAVSSGPGARYADSEYVQTAAATIPYRNDPNDLPPNRTLEELPRHGILFWVSLGRDARLPPAALERSDSYERTHPPPYRLSELQRVDGWEGQVRDIPDYRLWGVVGDRYVVDLRVYFGQKHPTRAMLEEADAVLRGLRFPDWGPWELERA